jgi:DNA recombination protein RmuC
MPVLLLIIGLLLGAALGWLAARTRSAADVARLDATLRATREGEERLGQSLRALSQDAARDQQMALHQLVAPLQESLYRYERRVAELERDRIDSYAELRTEVRTMAGVSHQLRAETSQLVAALRAPTVRGRWGEHQLRRIVEAAGMLEHCDFVEQVSARNDTGAIRPDLVVQLSGGRHVVVDAKAPFDAYLAALESRDERARADHLALHAKALRGHVDALSAKEYWSGFASTPEFVVLFVPADPFLDAALQSDPTLLEHAFSRDVVLATPATLVALLRTVAYAWRQEALTANALAVHSLGRDLYARLATMGGCVAKLGSSLGAAVTAYNRAVGSLESRVLVSARKLADLGVSGDSLDEPVQLEVTPRQLQAPEFDEPPPADGGIDLASPDLAGVDLTGLGPERPLGLEILDSVGWHASTPPEPRGEDPPTGPAGAWD